MLLLFFFVCFFFFSILTICLNLFSGIYVLCGRWLLMSLAFLFFFLHLYTCFSFHAWILLGDCVSVYFSGYRMIAQDCAQKHWISKDSSLCQEICLWLGTHSKFRSKFKSDFSWLLLLSNQPFCLSHVCVCVCVCVSGFILSQIWGLLRCSLFFSEYACGLVHMHSLPDSDWNMWELIKVIKSASFPGLPN